MAATAGSPPRPLRITIASIGTRGDLQPYTLLAVALRARGHTVAIATEERMREFVVGCGLECRVIEGDFCGLLFDRASQAALTRDSSLSNFLRVERKWREQFDSRKVLDSYVAALSGADVIVANATSLTESLCVAHYTGAALVPLLLRPGWETSEFPLWAMDWLPSLCSCLNVWTYRLVFRMSWAKERARINAWRAKSLGLPPIEDARGCFGLLQSTRTPTVFATSALLCGPRRRVPFDWPSCAHLVGFILADEDEEVSPEVEAAVTEFVARDPSPVVYVGFGSMPIADPLAFVRLVLDACAIAGARAIMVEGWSALTGTPALQSLLKAHADVLLVLHAAPHAWLFRQVSAVAHHCGVGTTAAALRAGVPQVGVPYMADQPWLAHLTVRLRVAPAYIPFVRLTPSRLGSALKVILDERGVGPLCLEAARLAKVVRAESAGAAVRACEAIEAAAAAHRAAVAPTAGVGAGSDSTVPRGSGEADVLLSSSPTAASSVAATGLGRNVTQRAASKGQ